MVRRLKKDVLKDLPEKERRVVKVDISSTSKEGKECKAAIRQWKGLSPEDEESIAEIANGGGGGGSDFDARQAMMKAYQLGGISKVAACGDYIEEWLDGSAEKVLIFGHHKLVLDGKSRKSVTTIRPRCSSYDRNLIHLTLTPILLPNYPIYFRSGRASSEIFLNEE